MIARVLWIIEHEGIESTLTLLAAQIGEGIGVVKDYADLKPIGCSPGQLNQVFMHLIKNAIQAVRRGKRRAWPSLNASPLASSMSCTV